jgi:hypothetical protein
MSCGAQVGGSEASGAFVTAPTCHLANRLNRLRRTTEPSLSLAAARNRKSRTAENQRFDPSRPRSAGAEGYPDLFVWPGREKMIVELKAVSGELGAPEEQQIKNYIKF